MIINNSTNINKTNNHLSTVMVNNSTNINKTNNHLSPETIEHNKWLRHMTLAWFGLWCLTPLSTIFQLHHDGQFYWRSTRKNHRRGASHWQTLSHNVVHLVVHRRVASHWQTLSHNVVHLALIEIRTHNITGDRH